MKDLVIQALESKGVLGQIRARLRSAVFKIVDEQDQQYKMGCGLQWENPLLYKILETKIGQLLSEIIREFMEYFRMDYSLSIFIPECGISPERLKKEEILGKLGINGDNLEIFSKLQLPILYYIIFYFLDNLKKKPNDVIDSIVKAQENIEKQSDEIITSNLSAIEEPQYNNPDDIPLSDQSPRIDKKNEETKDEVKKSDIKSSVPPVNVDGSDKGQRNSEPQTRKNDPDFYAEDKNEHEEDVQEEIQENIILEEEFDRSNDKRNSSSNNAGTITMSGGADQSVDSHKLEKYNFVENAEKVNN